MSRVGVFKECSSQPSSRILIGSLAINSAIKLEQWLSGKQRPLGSVTCASARLPPHAQLKDALKLNKPRVAADAEASQLPRPHSGGLALVRFFCRR